MEHNAVGWVEIPVSDMERASEFYKKVLGAKLDMMEFGETQMAIINWVDGDAKGAGAALVQNEKFYVPSSDGTLVYFTSPAGDLQVELARVEEAGGKILIPRRQISEDHGFMAVILDTEGNRIALHSRK